MKTKSASLLLALSILLPGAAIAAPVTWQTPFNISGDSDIDNRWEAVYAYNLGGSDTVTVNGVTFLPFTWTGADPAAGQGVTVGPVTVGPDTTPPRGISKAATGGGNNAPYNTLSTSYQTLVGSMVYAGAGYTHITLSGLELGTTYQVQFWVNDSRNVAVTRDATLIIRSGGSASEELSLQVDPQASAGNLGQTIIGTFVADAPTQQFVFEGLKLDAQNRPAYAYVNGVSLQAVPEPGAISAVLLGCGVLALPLLKKLKAR